MLNFISDNQGSLILTGFIALLIFLAWLIFLQIKLFLVTRKQKRMLQGVKLGNLEEALLKQVKLIEKNSQDIQELSHFARKVSDNADVSIKKVALMRFNPFEDAGGDQSFALALLDSFNNGVVISSLHSREGSRAYAKPITKGQSKYHLSDEEQTVLKKAIGGK
jgi:hypothetical protein